ncbi:uncharacterized protein LOC5575770 isoform X2 [Aedes aegypti]|uniref:Uncharacterized protein n=1 Tax=Aedes aegypti TaxID=7159 RepID=A0A6I8U5N0_AEDAE|nr:uncharacterized protein LOC5575770 isoform X2 [Aedes aegypti]
MTSTLFESDSFNRRFVEKLVEQRDRILRGDEVSVWQQIALELSQDWELDCGDLRWQDLSRYFKRSLVFKLSHRKWTTDQGLIDRLQYPYLRKVYVVTIQFYDRACPAMRVIENISEIQDNKLFIKYTMDGRFDPDVVAAFKRRSRKGVRIYVNINVGDPVYNLPEDAKKLLLQMEHHRKERPHRKGDSHERVRSPVGTPTVIESGSPPEKIFSPRDLLEKESFSVNTQEYDEIIKESLERELPPLPKRRRLSPGCVEVWLESCEILSSSASMVDGQIDPLHMSIRSGPEKMNQSSRVAGGSLSEPQMNPACLLEELTVVRSQPPTRIMASQPTTLAQESIHIKQEPEIESAREKPPSAAGCDPFLNNILAESDDEEEEDERTDHSYAKEKSNSVVIEQHGASGKEILESSTIIASRSLHEPLAVVRRQPPTLIMASQPLSSQQNSIQPKQEPETEPLSVAPTLETGHQDPFLDSVLTDSDDDDEEEREKEDESNSRRTTSNPTGAIGNIDVALIDSSHAPISNDNRSESQTTEVIAPVVRKQSPTVIVAKPTQESVPIKKEISIPNEPSSAEAYHDPFLNGVFTDSEDEEDDDEEEQNIPDKLHNELPDIIVSSEIPYPSTTKDTVSTPIETEHLETSQSTNVESNTQRQTHSINTCFNRHSDNTIAAEAAQTQLQPSESETQSITNPTDNLSAPNLSIESTTALQYSGVDRLGIQALDNSLKSVPRHFIVKQRLPLTVPVDPPINGLIGQPIVGPGDTEVQGVTNKVQMIQSPLRSESSRIEDLAEDSEPFEHSYQSPDSNRLFIAWSPSSATNSSGFSRTSRAPEPPTTSSPTASKFQAEQYDSIQPSIESRLRFQIVLRSLWPTLFARDDSFCDFLHLISVLAQNIFPLLQPNTGHAAMALLRMVTPIASRLAYGSFEPTENDNFRSLTETNDRNQITNRTDNERETSKRQIDTQSNLSTDETPSLVISDDDEEGELPVRLKRHYRVHQTAPSHTD